MYFYDVRYLAKFVYISIFYAFYVVPLKNGKVTAFCWHKTMMLLYDAMKNREEKGNEKADDAAVDGDAGEDDDDHDKKKVNILVES